MTVDLPIAERRLKSTARIMHQGMWLLFAVTACLIVVVRRTGTLRTGSMWLLSCGILAFMLSFALRDVIQKVVRRNTEDRLVNEVKNFLQQEPVLPVMARRPVVHAAAPPEIDPIPARAEFVYMKSIAPRGLDAELVVFDAIPAREAAHVRMNFFPVLMPVRPVC